MPYPKTVQSERKTFQMEFELCFQIPFCALLNINYSMSLCWESISFLVNPKTSDMFKKLITASLL